MPGNKEKNPLYTCCCPSIRPQSLCRIDYPTQHDMDVISAYEAPLHMRKDLKEPDEPVMSYE